MDPSTFGQWATLLGPFGLCGAIFIYGLIRGWWVMGSAYREAVERSKKYEEQAWRLLELTSTLKDVAAQALERSRER